MTKRILIKQFCERMNAQKISGLYWSMPFPGEKLYNIIVGYRGVFCAIKFKLYRGPFILPGKMRDLNSFSAAGGKIYAAYFEDGLKKISFTPVVDGNLSVYEKSIILVDGKYKFWERLFE